MSGRRVGRTALRPTERQFGRSTYTRWTIRTPRWTIARSDPFDAHQTALTTRGCVVGTSDGAPIERRTLQLQPPERRIAQAACYLDGRWAGRTARGSTYGASDGEHPYTRRRIAQATRGWDGRWAGRTAAGGIKAARIRRRIAQAAWRTDGAGVTDGGLYRAAWVERAEAPTRTKKTALSGGLS